MTDFPKKVLPPVFPSYEPTDICFLHAMKLCESCIRTIQETLHRGAGGSTQHELLQYPQLLKASCWLCKKLVAWVEDTHPMLFKKWRGLPMTFVFNQSVVAIRDGPGHLLPCEIVAMPRFRGEVIDSDECVINLDFMSEEELRRAMNIETNQQSTTADLNLIQTWVDNCTQNHHRCINLSAELWYPTRLLHLASDGQVKLVITKSTCPKGPYVTLSHRWQQNAHRFTMLLSSTIQQMQQGINVRRLPRTFQDAILLTRRLGVEYLWIDSLCIIQDPGDQSDWNRESILMEKVYSHAFVNISATLAENGTEGLLVPRQSHAFSAPPGIEVNAHGKIETQYIINSDFWHDQVSNAPLNKRGWVFQERFLARRVIHFGPRQIGWECQQMQALESFPRGLPPTLTVGSRSKPAIYEALRELSQVALASPQAAQNAPRFPTADLQFAEWWNSTMEDYSRCRFTFVKDKLVALAGVAKYVARNRPADRYLAGMWQSCLAHSLAWFRIHQRGRVYSNRDYIDCRVPSWSWASFDGEICFPSIVQGSVHQFIKVVQLAEDPLLVERSCNVDFDTSHHSFIKIEGFLLPVHISWSEGTIESLGIVGHELRFSENEGPEGTHIDLEQDDWLREMADTGHLYLVPLYASTYSMQAMLLARVGDTGHDVYRRVGAIEIVIAAVSTDLYQGMNEESEMGEGDIDHPDVPLILNQNALRLLKFTMDTNENSSARKFRSVIEII
ncbi:HET domain-containing protein [Aspergillus niger CBS 101883]|uniref:HET domain-containing protein n=1 Tax=Aspergillus lacticoffeatus (strain CBS 101883) TaxID=1450533 RepID=UPI000D803D5E|nr:HET-domain-containing protein [Aspergillus niger CBS 101883]PYH51302.1 HET-domain-containing protein [Aspergillus niger CBS 101883]